MGGVESPAVVNGSNWLCCGYSIAPALTTPDLICAQTSRKDKFERGPAPTLTNTWGGVERRGQVDRFIKSQISDREISAGLQNGRLTIWR